MPSSTRLASLALFTLFSLFTNAQQYAGNPIPNSLQAVDGAAVSYFKISNASNPSGPSTTLINYFSAPEGKAQDPSSVQRAIVVLHGANRDPWNYWTDMYTAMQNASNLYNSEISENSVAIMAPYFANEADANTGYPVSNGQSTTNALVWYDTQWSAGLNNIYPTNQTGISSYDILDQAITYFANTTLYPNMKQIVVAGHSMGAQMAQRYSVIGKQLNISVPLTIWTGNPDSFAWLNSTRPVAPSSCDNFDDWEFGLSAYNGTYNSPLLVSGPAAVAKNLAKKSVAYARGLNDFGDYSEGCAPYSQGANRGERFLNFLTAFPPNKLDTVDYYPGVGHDDLSMFGHEPGSYRLFLDNWSGNKSRAADFGPRQISDDNPHPVST